MLAATLGVQLFKHQLRAHANKFHQFSIGLFRLRQGFVRAEAGAADFSEIADDLPGDPRLEGFRGSRTAAQSVHEPLAPCAQVAGTHVHRRIVVGQQQSQAHITQIEGLQGAGRDSGQGLRRRLAGCGATGAILQGFRNPCRAGPGAQHAGQAAQLAVQLGGLPEGSGMAQRLGHG